MGRARGQGAGAVATGFAGLFGERRGSRRDDDGLLALHPTPLAHAAAESLRLQMQAGQLDEAAQVLSSYRSRLSARPLLAELADEMVTALLDEQLQANDDANHGFVKLVGLRHYWANQLVGVEEVSETSEATIHIWPPGENRGERNLATQYASHQPVVVACGRSFGVSEVHRHVPRGAWQEPTFDNEGSPWRFRRCSDCEATAAKLTVADCEEQPRAYPVLASAELESWKTEARTRIRRHLPGSLGQAARIRSPRLMRYHAKHILANALTEAVAARLAADGDVAVARIQGYPSDFPRLPSYEEWLKLLDEFKPTAANAKRYAAKATNKSILSKFDAAVRHWLVLSNPE